MSFEPQLAPPGPGVLLGYTHMTLLPGTDADVLGQYLADAAAARGMTVEMIRTPLVADIEARSYAADIADGRFVDAVVDVATFAFRGQWLPSSGLPADAGPVREQLQALWRTGPAEGILTLNLTKVPPPAWNAAVNIGVARYSASPTTN